MNKFFIFFALIVVVVLAAKKPDTYKKCFTKHNKAPKCNACQPDKRSEKACTDNIAAGDATCKKIENCYKKIDKTPFGREAALDAMYKAFCPTKKKKCRDSDPAWCPTWAKKNECQTNAKFMIPSCQNSCCPICNSKTGVKEGSCPSTDSPELCQINTHESCETWARRPGKKSECKKNPRWMNTYCMQSCCPACKRDLDGCPAVKEGCDTRNKQPTKAKGKAKCERWAKAGECENNKKWMNKNCANQCCTLCTTALAPKASPVAAPAAPQVIYYRG